MSTEKECSRCHTVQPLDEEHFYKSPRHKDGYYGICRECHRTDVGRRSAAKRNNGIARARDLGAAGVKLGETCKLVADPQQCYIVGSVHYSGSVTETLLFEGGQWAEGTQFETQVVVRKSRNKVVAGWQVVTYEVRGAIGSGQKLVRVGFKTLDGAACHNCGRIFTTKQEPCTCGRIICEECRESGEHTENGRHWLRCHPMPPGSSKKSHPRMGTNPSKPRLKSTD